MILALPALLPGFLPIVLMLVLLTRPSRAEIVDATVITLAVQWLSVGFIAILTGSYIRQLRLITHRAHIQGNGAESRAYNR